MATLSCCKRILLVAWVSEKHKRIGVSPAVCFRTMWLHLVPSFWTKCFTNWSFPPYLPITTDNRRIFLLHASYRRFQILLSVHLYCFLSFSCIYFIFWNCLGWPPGSIQTYYAFLNYRYRNTIGR